MRGHVSMADSGKNETRSGSGRNQAQNGRNGHGQEQPHPTAATFDARSLWPSLQVWFGNGVRQVRSQVLRRTATTGPTRSEGGLAGGQERPQNAERPEAGGNRSEEAGPSRSAVGGTTETDGIQHQRLRDPAVEGSKVSLKYILNKAGLRKKKKKGA